MGKALPEQDESVRWPVHEPCRVKHAPDADCPPRGRWLGDWAAGRTYVPGQRKRTR